MGLLVRIFLFIGGLVASFLVAQDLPRYQIMQSLMGILILTLAIALLAFWPEIRTVLGQKKRSDEET